MYVDVTHVPLNPRHVWHLSKRQLEAQIDAIVDRCMMHGETGWSPHAGGMSTIDRGKLPYFLFARIDMKNDMFGVESLTNAISR